MSSRISYVRSAVSYVGSALSGRRTL